LGKVRKLSSRINLNEGQILIIETYHAQLDLSSKDEMLAANKHNLVLDHSALSILRLLSDR
jgi:hypothetical protein